MNPLVMFMMDSMVRNRSDVVPLGGLVYLDSFLLDESSSSTTSGVINTTTTTTISSSSSGMSDDGFLQQQQSSVAGGLAVLIIDGELPVASTTAATALIMDWSSVAVAAALTVIVLLTIGGNLLILAAVLFNSNLRGPTHILIANLAVADLLLGFLVLPFSATLEVTGNWYFGAVFCDVWAAVDVLCCTASIMSLCVISVDRYIGVTRPLNYYSIVTAKRSTVLCIIVWISSLSISIGPLLGWKERSDFTTTISGNESAAIRPTMPAVTEATTLIDASLDQQACNVNKEKGYVLFSAIGSFYLPTLVILAVYWRIYRAAVKQTKFLESGTKTDKSTSSLSNEVLTLRVHVGRATPLKPVTGHTNHLHVVTKAAAGRSSARSSIDSVGVAAAERNASAGSDRSSRKNNRNCRTPPSAAGQQQQAPLPPSPPPLDSELAKDLDEATGVLMKKSLASSNAMLHSQQRRGSRRPSSAGSTTAASSTTLAVTTAGGTTTSSTGLSAKMFKFRRQKKAAKTLGIVVGAFLLCWFPFFVILPVEALCSTCGIPSPLFSCCFWLGYCNSCLNPFIYASTSREFKRAFSKILCGRRGTLSGAGGRNLNYQQHHLLPPRNSLANSVGNVSPALRNNKGANPDRPHSSVDQCAT